MKKLLFLSFLLIPINGDSTVLIRRPGTDITTGLSAYWKLDENTGTAPQDSAGTNHGSFSGSPTWITGKTNSGLRFTSAGASYVALGSVAVGNTATFSISLWLRDNGGTHDNVEYGEGNTGNGSPLLLVGNNQSATGDICAEMRDDSLNDSLICHSNSYNDNVWHHVVYVRYSNSSAELFIDGTSRGTNSTTVGTRTFNNARIGSLGRLAGGFTDGDVDQVRIYTIALNSTQINYLKDNGL